MSLIVPIGLVTGGAGGVVTYRYLTSSVTSSATVSGLITTGIPAVGVPGAGGAFRIYQVERKPKPLPVWGWISAKIEDESFVYGELEATVDGFVRISASVEISAVLSAYADVEFNSVQIAISVGHINYQTDYRLAKEEEDEELLLLVA